MSMTARESESVPETTALLPTTAIRMRQNMRVMVLLPTQLLANWPVARSTGGSLAWYLLAEPAQGPRQRVLGVLVLAERPRVVLARTGLILLGKDVLEDDAHLELLSAPGQLQALFCCRERLLRRLELFLLGQQSGPRFDDLARDAVLHLLEVPPGLFPPGACRADASEVEEPARPEAPADRGHVISRPSECGGGVLPSAAESAEKGLSPDRRDEGTVDRTLLGPLGDVHQGLGFFQLRAGREGFLDEGVD